MATKDAVREYEAKRYAEALALFETAQKAAPDDPVIWRYKGMCLLYLRKFAKAAEALSTAIEKGLADELESAYFHLGIAHRYSPASRSEEDVLAAVERAAEAFSRCVETDDGYAEAHFQLGLCYLQLRMFMNAEPEFRRALDLAKKSDAWQARAWLGLAKAVVEKLDFDEVLRCLENAFALDPRIRAAVGQDRQMAHTFERAGAKARWVEFLKRTR